MESRKGNPPPNPFETAALDEEVNKYGVPLGIWAGLTPKQKQLHYRRLSQKKRHEHNLASSRNTWAKMSPEKKARSYALARARRSANIEDERRKEREYYAANVERIRAQWQRSYWRNRQTQLARSRRGAARRRSQKQITLSPDAVFLMIDKAVSKALPRFVRDDVIATCA